MNTKRNDKILLFEPFWRGSHRYYWDLFRMNSAYDVDVIKTESKQWKWANALSALEFQNAVQDKNLSDYKAFLFSDYADLQGIRPVLPKNAPVLLFMHENQFGYPTQHEDARDFQFALKTMTSLMSADLILFNSDWNLQSTLEGFSKARRRIPSQFRQYFHLDWREKSHVCHLGVDVGDQKRKPYLRDPSLPPRVLWNHRWEHDKRPQVFLETMVALKNEGVGFELILCGEMNETAKTRYRHFLNELADRTLHIGLVPSRDSYLSWLQSADIAVSVATHEFFGISMMEAAMTGSHLVLPHELSYPELYKNIDEGVSFFESDQEFVHVLRSVLDSTRVGCQFEDLQIFDAQHAASRLDLFIQNALGGR